MPKVGVIGAGYWGPNLIRNFCEMGCLEVICDKDKKRLNKMGREYSTIKTTVNVDEAISNADAIVVATEAGSHYKIAKKALVANKDVFVEKPLTLSIQEGEELIKLAKERALILMVGHILLYHPAVKKLKEYVRDSTFGDIYYIYSQRVNLGQIRKDEDALWSFGPHDVSVILYLMDEMPDKITATGEAYLQKGVKDVVFITLYFTNKVIAHIHLSWLDPHKIRKITVVGAKKMAVFDDMETIEKLRVYDKGVDYKPSFKSYAKTLTIRTGDILIPKIEMNEPLRLECQHFIECVIKRSKPLSDGENGIKVTKILQAAQRSLYKEGIPIQIR
ncbi:MAG: Gfo/Idh/MocA family oxidoreductase [bacterium]|nr:Gfo/Idh/MocA family oxidoreductase [bacterium]